MLRLITAWSSEDLADWLADWYAAPTGDPFARELVVVPTPGMERYLTRRLALRLGVSDPGAEDGVCAAVDFVQPQDLMTAVLARDLSNQEDPWAPAALQWHCLRAIDELVARPDAQLVGLRHHLRAGTRDARRIGVAREIAQLLGNYAVQRPELLLDWTNGKTDQTPPQFLWQADVFRHVLARVSTPPWPLRVRDLLADGVGEEVLPPRLAVFGVTRYGVLDQQFLEVLARDREVVVLMVEHSPGRADRPRDNASDIRDESVSTAGNQLVDTLGGEELVALRTLASMHPDRTSLTGYPEPTGSVLSRVQAGIARDEPVSSAPVEPGDESLTVHGCAGPLRQVEVLRDQILGLLQRDDSLQARDVLVMCTDLDVFAPLIAQVFGTATAPIEGPTRDLRVSVADRIARIDNPVLQVVQTLGELLATRMTRAAVLDLMELPAVADRYGLDAQAHSRVERLVAEAGVRWGLDSDHRAAFGVPAGDANTWQTGLDRLAAGLAVDGRVPILMNGIAPTEAAADSDVALVAALDEVVTTLQAAWQFARSPHPAREWATALAGWIEPLVGGDARWRMAAAMSVVSQALDGAEPIGLGEVATLLAAELARYGPRPRLLAGGVDVVAMRPMRNIPYRVVCLLGMDDGAFPRSATLGGNDLLAVDPRPGERDPRAEDRQLFLDAVCAAQHHLVITYSSINPRSGNPLPPAAPLAELLAELGDSVGDVVHEHPLVPHDPRNFTTDTRRAVSVSFDRTAAAVASTVAPRPVPLRDVRMSAPPEDVALEDLIAFWRNPGSAFLRRLGLAVERDEEQDEQELVLDLNALAAWKLGNALVKSDQSLSDACSVALARGALPVVGAEAAWAEVATKVMKVRDAVAATPTRGREFTHLELPLDPMAGTVLTGVLRHPAEGPVVHPAFSRLKGSDVLDLRIRVAALSAAGVGNPGALVWPGTRRGITHEERPWEPGKAAHWLRTLSYLRQVGLSRPLPFAAKASYSYAKAVSDMDRAVEEARKKWSGPFGGRGERDAPENRALWESDWGVLTGVPPMAVTWLPTDSSLFGQLARFVFGEQT